jgi:hypothetical protein
MFFKEVGHPLAGTVSRRAGSRIAMRSGRCFRLSRERERTIGCRGIDVPSWQAPRGQPELLRIPLREEEEGGFGHAGEGVGF